MTEISPGRRRWVEYAREHRKDTGVVPPGPPVTAVRRFARRFRGQRPALAALIVLALLGLLALLAPWVAPHDPDAGDLNGVLAGPGPDHLLGTDQNGRDVLSRLVFGARVSLVAALQAVAVALALGGPPGLLAGYLGGWVDLIVNRIVEAMMSFPPLLLAIAIVGVRGPGLGNAMLAIGIASSPRFCRLLRGVTLSARQENYVEAARSIGCSTWRILGRHILPNVVSPLVVQLSLAMGFAMLAEASLSFLGLGVTPPAASWGSMLGQAFRFLGRDPWLAVPPGVALTLAVLAFNVLGDGVRDAIGRQDRRNA
ncbi:ABC transporter permease [Spirillospora sp. CA-255316]